MTSKYPRREPSHGNVEIFRLRDSRYRVFIRNIDGACAEATTVRAAMLKLEKIVGLDTLCKQCAAHECD